MKIEKIVKNRAKQAKVGCLKETIFALQTSNIALIPFNPISVGLWNDVNGRAGAIMAPINFKPYGSCQRFVSVKNLF